jgi:hypothetical protein
VINDKKIIYTIQKGIVLFIKFILIIEISGLLLKIIQEKKVIGIDSFSTG